MKKILFIVFTFLLILCIYSGSTAESKTEYYTQINNELRLLNNSLRKRNILRSYECLTRINNTCEKYIIYLKSIDESTEEAEKIAQYATKAVMEAKKYSYYLKLAKEALKNTQK